MRFLESLDPAVTAPVEQLAESLIMRAERSRRRAGPAPMDPEERRSVLVNLRLNGAELRRLDAQIASAGGHIKRGVWIRMAWQQLAAEAPAPESNRSAWADLARAQSNVATIASHYPGDRIVDDLASSLRDSLAKTKATLLSAPSSKTKPGAAGAGLSPSELTGRVSDIILATDRERRRGPELLPEGEARTTVVSVRLTEEEAETLDRQVSLGRSASPRRYARGEWLRMAWRAIYVARPPEFSEPFLASLNASGRVLNEIAAALSAGASADSRRESAVLELGVFAARLTSFSRSISSRESDISGAATVASV